jgi:hypothetical protein
MVNRIVPHSSPGGHGLPLPWAFASHTTLVLGQVPAQDTGHLLGPPLACASHCRDAARVQSCCDSVQAARAALLQLLDGGHDVGGPRVGAPLHRRDALRRAACREGVAALATELLAARLCNR